MKTRFQTIIFLLLASLIIATSANAFYDPTKGRFLSRDPIGEQGGMNLYAFVGNDAVNYIDSFGLWRVVRDGKARAMAYAEYGDTIRRLSAVIRLNAREWKQWIKAERVETKPYSLDTRLTSCDIFSVPNTAYVDYDVGLVSIPLALAARRYSSMLQDRWHNAGYFVDYSRWIMGKDIVLSHLSDPKIYAYAYIGHGAAGSLILGEEEKDWVVAGKYTPFGIVEMELIACSTEYAWEKWRKNVSKDGLLITVDGDFTASQMNLKNHSGE